MRRSRSLAISAADGSPGWTCPSCGRDAPGSRWLQANVEVGGGRPGNSRAEDPDAALVALIERVKAMHEAGRVRGFFFSRRPLGLRVRFELPAGSGRMAALAEVMTALQAMSRTRAIRGWTASCYEPETFIFGGARATTLVHDHFLIDSVAFCRWDGLRRRGRARISMPVISLAVLNDLFTRVAEGPDEMWDLWCQVAALHRAPVRTDASLVPRLTVEQLLARASGEERAILADQAAANQRLADGLRSLHRAGELLYRYRSILPHVALHHWNRLDFAPDERRTLHDAMTTAWAPVTHLAVDGLAREVHA